MHLKVGHSDLDFLKKTSNSLSLTPSPQGIYTVYSKTIQKSPILYSVNIFEKIFFHKSNINEYLIVLLTKSTIDMSNKQCFDAL